jgi:hypothetical protein
VIGDGEQRLPPSRWLAWPRASQGMRPPLSFYLSCLSLRIHVRPTIPAIYPVERRSIVPAAGTHTTTTRGVQEGHVRVRIYALLPHGVVLAVTLHARMHAACSDNRPPAGPAPGPDCMHAMH